MLKIAVISDTHGLLRPEARQKLSGVDLIFHAGDIGSKAVLEELQAIAPLKAVRGNVDSEVWAQKIPYTLVIEAESVLLYMLHDLHMLAVNPAAAGFQAVIYGHSHKPSLEYRQDILYLNPGSIGPRRFKLPISMAMITVDGKDFKAELITL